MGVGNARPGITQRGRLFYDGREGYVFENDSKQLLAVDRDDPDMRLFMMQYGVAPTDGFFKHALSAIGMATLKDGKETRVYSLSHYDMATNRIYGVRFFTDTFTG